MIHHHGKKGERVMANPFIHVELATTDVAKAKEFYGTLFDWQLEDIEGMDYTFINVGEGTGGGMMKTVQPDSPSYWMAYVLVDDVAVATEKARSLGATICKGVTEVPGFGWFSVITDPTGATLALWQVNRTGMS
jgi:predicted enzyme related to lactoylglutathione lyase